MTQEEIAAMLADHLKWLRDEGGKRANLSGANLFRAILSGANLSGAILSGANLSDAILSGANLFGANLSGVNLTGANLFGANLTDASLSGANLSGVNLTDAALPRANLTGANLTGANLYGANLSDAHLSGANLSGANLSGANLSDASLFGANLSGANLSGAKVNDKTAIDILRRATRSDGYEFFLWHCQEGLFVAAGCRWFTIEAARQHWTATRAGTPLGDETMDILDFFDATIKRMLGGFILRSRYVNDERWGGSIAARDDALKENGRLREDRGS
jgi:hypothetical protein